MGYQALLFCPDEKTARTVTHVLSELDFTVIPCTEPFAAVKKLMGEHFDAVVVDCDNEQNATLLFKSAHNSPSNQSALAVAVVEGQVGVAKAFRIGANLVLTKPINVEQAKGTLRVARGLLRKSEASKPATAAAGAATKPAVSAPAPVKPAPQRPTPTASSPVNSAVTSPRTEAPVAPLRTAAAAGIPAQPVPQPRVTAPVPSQSAASDAETFDLSEEVASSPAPKPAVTPRAPSSASASASASAAKIAGAVSSPVTAASKTPAAASTAASSRGFGSGAASAPAPAREPKPSVAPEEKPTATISKADSAVEEVASGSGSSTVEEASTHGTEFTLGGNVSETASAGDKKKKTLLIAAVILLIAVVGYAVWMQWESSSGAATPFTRVAPQPARAPAAVSQAPPSAAATSPAASSAAAPVQPSAASSVTSPQASEIAKAPADTQSAALAKNTAAHSSKSSVDDSPKPSASVAAANKVPSTKAAAEPIVVKASPIKSGAKKSAASDVAAPSMTGMGSTGDVALPDLGGGSSDAPAPVLQAVTVSQGVSQGLLVKKTPPVYPPSALRQRVEGAVQLSATISPKGNISAVKILSGEPQLARAAADAVKQWKYKPYLLNGAPVEIETQITVKFTLPN